MPDRLLVSGPRHRQSSVSLITFSPSMRAVTEDARQHGHLREREVMTGYRPSRGRRPRVVIARLRLVMPVACVAHLRFFSAYVECLPRPVERLSRAKWRGRRAVFALVFRCAPAGARNPVQPLKRVRLGHNRRRPRSPDAPLRAVAGASRAFFRSLSNGRARSRQDGGPHRAN